MSLFLSGGSRLWGTSVGIGTRPVSDVVVKDPDDDVWLVLWLVFVAGTELEADVTVEDELLLKSEVVLDVELGTVKKVVVDDG
jgi:hypothetical protein